MDAVAAATPPAADRRNRPNIFVRTDAVALESCDGVAASGRSTLHGVLALLASPVHYLNSARRSLVAAPCYDADHAHGVWLRLELRLPLQQLIDGAGNGRPGWLRRAFRMDFARSLMIEMEDVDVCDMFEIDGKTVVELVVSELKPSSSVCNAAVALVEQVERNRASVDGPSDLIKLISRVEVKDYAVRRRWNSMHTTCALAILTLLAYYHGCLADLSAAPALRSLSLRAPDFGAGVLHSWNEQVSRGLRACPHDLQLGLGMRSTSVDTNRMTMMLDLDHTCIFGNDGNDLGVVLQLMDKESLLDELYGKLINPNLGDTYRAYKSRGKAIDPVIYTRRPTLISFKSHTHAARIPMRFAAGWHAQGQVHTHA